MLATPEWIARVVHSENINRNNHGNDLQSRVRRFDSDPRLQIIQRLRDIPRRHLTNDVLPRVATSLNTLSSYIWTAQMQQVHPVGMRTSAWRSWAGIDSGRAIERPN